MISRSNHAENIWDHSYSSSKRYADEPAVPFAGTIIMHVHTLAPDATGLYIGCGNGRNFIPLSLAGLNLTGLDISKIALDQLIQKQPTLSNRLIHQSIADYQASKQFDYIIAIQVLQHGCWQQIEETFQKISNALKPGGLFFVRVRSINMPIKHKYEIIEKTPEGGLTIQFLEGPKEGLYIHYFSKQELNLLIKRNFRVINAVKEVTTEKPKFKSHFEAIWKKTG